MGLFNNFPYMDLSNLNLDFILKKLKDLTNYAESAAQDAQRAETASATAVLAKESAELSASSAQQSAESAEASAESAQDYAENIADPVGGLVTGWLDDNITPTTPPVDASLTIQGAAADAKATGDAIDDLRGQLSGTIPYPVKIALDSIIQNVAFKSSADFTSEKSAIHAWATDISLLSIDAVYTPGDPVTDMDSLDVLKNNLVVTANYSDGTSVRLPDNAYTLSGTLNIGTDTITVSYMDKTDTFDVTVVMGQPSITQISIGSAVITGGTSAVYNADNHARAVVNPFAFMAPAGTYKISMGSYNETTTYYFGVLGLADNETVRNADFSYTEGTSKTFVSGDAVVIASPADTGGSGGWKNNETTYVLSNPIAMTINFKKGTAGSSNFTSTDISNILSQLSIVRTA